MNIDSPYRFGLNCERPPLKDVDGLPRRRIPIYEPITPTTPPPLGSEMEMLVLFPTLKEFVPVNVAPPVKAMSSMMQLSNVAVPDATDTVACVPAVCAIS
jgi:hypothetical protein